MILRLAAVKPLPPKMEVSEMPPESLGPAEVATQSSAQSASTSKNHLSSESGQTITDAPRGGCAINCTSLPTIPVSEKIDGFVRASLSENSRRAYVSDIARFKLWGGTLPSTAQAIAAYLSDHAATHATTTLVRWLASLSKAHRALKAQDPTKDELVRSVLRGIWRQYGGPPKQAAPLTREILFDVLDAIPNDLRGTRDRALLLIGFAGGFRRSELVSLEPADLMKQEEGLVLTIRRSKTDQTGHGRKIGIPFARGRHCAIKALDSWLSEREALGEGAIFRSINRHGVISNKQLSGQAVSMVIKDRLQGAGIESSTFSGHSLRAGFITSAAKAGISSWKIRQQTGHASDAMLGRYIRDSEIFVENPAGALL